MTNGVEDLGGHAALAADVVAHHADECLAALVFHVGQAAEIGSDRGQIVIRVHGERDGDFACRNHIDGAVVLIKDGEDFFQIAVGHQHAAGHHVDDAEPLFDGDGLERAPK